MHWRVIYCYMIRRTQSVLFALFAVFSLTFGTVLPAFAAVSTPTNLTLVGGVYTNDATPTFTWNRPAGATWYEFTMDDGSWKSIGNVGTYTHRELPSGWHTFFLRAHNNAGDISVSTSITFEIDTEGPNVSAVSPLNAVTHRPVTFTVTAGSSDVMATYCALYVQGRGTFDMNAEFSSSARSRAFTRSLTFTDAPKSVEVYAKCKDGDGNWTQGPVRTVSVTSSGSAMPKVNIAHGTVMKAQCDSYAPKSDSCHAVYYFGHDGKRHAFTSEAVYQSWYGNSYAGMVIISEAQMHAIPVGENVTIRPGTNLVKFSGSTTVYAVEKGAVLRPIVNEAVAKAIYGSRWVSAIVSLPSTVRGDYMFGEKIDSSSDYSKYQAYASVHSIDENF